MTELVRASSVLNNKQRVNQMNENLKTALLAITFGILYTVVSTSIGF